MFEETLLDMKDLSILIGATLLLCFTFYKVGVNDGIRLCNEREERRRVRRMRS